jgi:Pentapeptide repeats (9 copies)
VIKSQPEEDYWRSLWIHRSGTWWWTALLIVLPVITLTAVALTVLLFTIDVTNDTTAQIELIRMGLTVGAGTGGVVALILAGRRQWSTERAAQSTEHDATERRVTELYIKGVEQLGSDKAPVRLAGLYALERLADHNPLYRQSIVNVICAYLRMPYVPPSEFMSRSEYHKRKIKRVDDSNLAEQFESHEELQVRRTAQRILTDHMGAHRYSHGGQSTPVTHWGDLSIDLKGATLVEFDMSNAIVYEANFYEARFLVSAIFTNTKFLRPVNFAVASFGWLGCLFHKTVFKDAVYFGDTKFVDGRASFESAQFHGDIRFGGIHVAPKGINLNGALIYDINALLQLPDGWSVEIDESSQIGKTIRDN